MSLVLQVNGSGAWKNVASLEWDHYNQVLAAAGQLAHALGPSPTFRITKVVDGHHQVQIADREIRALAPQAGALAAAQPADLLRPEDAETVDHFAFCLRAFLQSYGELSVIAFARVGAEMAAAPRGA